MSKTSGFSSGRAIWPVLASVKWPLNAAVK